jgi:hydroxymethylpyrimidine pyrophosphatase-like HAD family hydrolase
MLSDLGINSLSILMAGGVVARPDGSVLWSSGMKSSEASALVEGARRLKLDLELITTTDYFTERESDLLAIHASYHPKRSQHVEDLLKIAASEPVIKASIIIDPSAGLEGLEELRRALPELNFTVAHGAAHPDLYFVNVNSSETSPLKALEVLLREQNLRAADVISFGDGESDIPLLSTVGTSVAMENANEKVKRSAQWVTKSVEEDGVAAAIRELFNL